MNENSEDKVNIYYKEGKQWRKESLSRSILINDIVSPLYKDQLCIWDNNYNNITTMVYKLPLYNKYIPERDTRFLKIMDYKTNLYIYNDYVIRDLKKSFTISTMDDPTRKSKISLFRLAPIYKGDLDSSFLIKTDEDEFYASYDLAELKDVELNYNEKKLKGNYYGSGKFFLEDIDEILTKLREIVNKIKENKYENENEVKQIKNNIEYYLDMILEGKKCYVKLILAIEKISPFLTKKKENKSSKKVSMLKNIVNEILKKKIKFYYEGYGEFYYLNKQQEESASKRVEIRGFFNDGTIETGGPFFIIDTCFDNLISFVDNNYSLMDMNISDNVTKERTRYVYESVKKEKLLMSMCLQKIKIPDDYLYLLFSMNINLYSFFKRFIQYTGEERKENFKDISYLKLLTSTKGIKNVIRETYMLTEYEYNDVLFETAYKTDYEKAIYITKEIYNNSDKIARDLLKISINDTIGNEIISENFMTKII
jgi:hypothetical protein